MHILNAYYVLNNGGRKTQDQQGSVNLLSS